MANHRGGRNGRRSRPEGRSRGSHSRRQSLGIRVILVGKQDIVRAELAQHPRLADCRSKSCTPAKQVTMEDSAAKAVRNKRDSSIRVASRLVRDGLAHGFVSAGNTGAVMATAKMVQGMLPAWTVPRWRRLPHPQGHPGGGGGCGRERRLHSEHAGAIRHDGRHLFARDLSHRGPRVGLLSIGEEEHKGNELTRAATPLLKSLPIHFIGNVEGREFTAAI